MEILQGLLIIKYFSYLGGVAYAILVARVCQLYPNALPNVLLRGFFKIYQGFTTFLK
jgi:poly(A) polymerase Pap1